MESRRFFLDLTEVTDIVAQPPISSAISTQPADKATRRASAQLIFAERTSTIDQIKRIFAVVMGAAAVN